MAKRVRKSTKAEIVALLGVLDREVARRAKTPRKLTLLARATAAGRVTPFHAFGSISSMAGADAFGACKGVA